MILWILCALLKYKSEDNEEKERDDGERRELELSIKCLGMATIRWIDR